jgi:hypothetical protein
MFILKLQDAMSAENDERRQFPIPFVIWDGSIVRFEDSRNNLEGHYRKIDSEYSFDKEFSTYFERDSNFYVEFLDEVPSSSQVKKDAHALYCILLSACQKWYRT